MSTMKTLRQSALLLASLGVVVPHAGEAADLRLPIAPHEVSIEQFGQFLASRREQPATPEMRKALFGEFLRWNRTFNERK